MTSPIARRIAASALAGIATGLGACVPHGGAVAADDVVEVWIPRPGAVNVAVDDEGAAAARAAKARRAELAEPARGKDCCKGQNDCKGKGNCKVVGDHACKGKNDCKGRGGCKGIDCKKRGRAIK